MGRRRVLEAIEEFVKDGAKRYEFTHNEWFRRWYAWKCQGCGIVRLEDRPTEFETWLCDVCRVKFNSL